MAETKFTSYDEVLKSGLIGDILYLIISDKEKSKTYKDLLALDGGTVGILGFAVGGLEVLYKNMNTQTYFGKTEKEMIDGYSTNCRPPGKSGNDDGWGCYSQKFWYDGMKLFLDSSESKSIQEKTWSVKMKQEIEDVIKKGWSTKRQITIALAISNSLGSGGMKSIADSNKWDAEKTLQVYASKNEQNEKRRKLIDANFPFVKNVETTNEPNNTPTENTNNTSPNSIAESKPEIPKGPDFPEDKVFTFNVENSKFLVNAEIGTFSVVPINPEFDFEQDFDQVPLDDEYYEEEFAGQEQEISDLGEASVKPDDSDDSNSTGSSTSNQTENLKEESIDGLAQWSRKIKQLTKGSTWEVHAANYISLKEGFAAKAGWDVNHYRMGYGSEKIKRGGKLVEVKKGDTCTKQEAVDTLAEWGIPEFAKQIEKDLGTSYWNKLGKYQKAALVSLGYNVGAYYISARGYGNRIRDAIKAGDMKKAAKEILNGPRKASGKVLSGLVTRRKEEAQLFLLPDNKSIY